MKPNPVVHFEMPYEDDKRVADFYKKAFGWHSQTMGSEMGNYVVMTTTEMDEKTKFPKEPGRINGGFYKKSEMAPNPSVVIAVDDIKESIKKVKQAGGKILPNQDGKDEAIDIPGIGLYISFIDSEGNRVSMLQPSPMM